MERIETEGPIFFFKKRRRTRTRRIYSTDGLIESKIYSQRRLFCLPLEDI